MKKRMPLSDVLDMVRVANVQGEAYEVVEQALMKDIRMLGTDEIFALRDTDGEIRAFRQPLTLSVEAGTLIQPVSSGPFVISAQGYEVWAEAAGASVVFPSQVLVGNEWRQNPAVIRDEKNGRILMVYARAVAFRLSSKGIPMVSDWTTIYDTPSYRMIDLLSKAKDKPQAFKLLPIEMKPTEGGSATWAKYNFDEATALWMNTSHEEALKWLGSIINREKKSVDFAQTFAKRNALKHLSGLQKSPTGNRWTLSIIAWRPMGHNNIIKWDMTQYVSLQDKVQNLISGNKQEFKQIELKSSGVELSSEDSLTGALEMVTDMEDQSEIPAEVKPQQEEAAPEPTEKKAPPKKARKKGLGVHPEIANLEAAQESFPAEYEQAVKNLGIDPDEIRVPEAIKIMAELNKIIDSANTGEGK